MSEQVWLALITAVGTAVVTICGVATLFLNLRLKMLSMQEESRERAKVQAEQLSLVSDNVAKIETHSNSLTQQIAELSEKEALLRGADEERMRAAAQQSAINNGIAKQGVASGGGARVDVEHLAVDTMSVEKTAPKPNVKP